MSRFRLAQHLVLIIAGLSLGTILALASAPRAHAAGTTWIYPGFGTMCEDWGGYGHPCWHYDESSFPTFGALDMDRGMGSGDAGQVVYWIQGSTTSSYIAGIQFQALTMTQCTGVRVQLTGSLAGAFHYKHINPASGVIGSNWENWTVWPGWTQADRYLGTTAATQNCPFGGPHLHQSGDTDWWTDIQRNHPAQTVCTSSPLRWCWSSYAFTILWP